MFQREPSVNVISNKKILVFLAKRFQYDVGSIPTTADPVTPELVSFFEARSL